MRSLSSVALPLVESRIARRRRRLLQFQPPYRRYVAGLSSTSPAIEDLADSFPALLFALATGYGDAAGREAAFQSVIDGGSLKQAAKALGLPIWMRRLSAGALHEPLPALPTDEGFAADVSNRIPPTMLECRVWLDRMVTALRLGGRDLAIWVAQEPRLLPPTTGEDTFQWVLAWAWASTRQDCPGFPLLRGRWTRDIGLKRAIEEVSIWRKRIDLVGALADDGRDPWLPDSAVGSLEIVQLKSIADFIAESTMMENCLDQYAAHLAYGRVRIYSVRRDGQPLADVELTVRSEKPLEAVASQVRGPRNRRASPAVLQAVRTWLDCSVPRQFSVTPTPPEMARQHLDVFWRPYIAAIDAAGLTLRLPSAVFARDRIIGDARVPLFDRRREVGQRAPTVAPRAPVQRTPRAYGQIR